MDVRMHTTTAPLFKTCLLPEMPYLDRNRREDATVILGALSKGRLGVAVPLRGGGIGRRGRTLATSRRDRLRVHLVDIQTMDQRATLGKTHRSARIEGRAT